MALFFSYLNCRTSPREIKSDIDYTDDVAESVKSCESYVSLQKTSSKETEEEANASVNVGHIGGGDDSDLDQDDGASLLYGVELADPVCVKLND